MARKKANNFSKLSDPALNLVADCFQALSDPTRLKILRAIRAESKSVQELVGMFTCTQPNISRHLFILTKAGLVKKEKRGSYVLYTIADPRIMALCDNVCSHIQNMLAGYAGFPKKS